MNLRAVTNNDGTVLAWLDDDFDYENARMAGADSKSQKARKSYSCNGCSEAIEKGTIYRRDSLRLVADGKSKSVVFRLHPACENWR